MNSQFENGLNSLADHAAQGETTLNAHAISGAVRRRQNTRRAAQFTGGGLAIAALAFGAIQASGSFGDSVPAGPVPSPTIASPQPVSSDVDAYWGDSPDYILDPTLYPDAVVEGLLSTDQVNELFGDFTAAADLSGDPLNSTGDWDYQVADISDDWLLLTYAYIEPPQDAALTQELVEGDPRVVSVNRRTGEVHVLDVFSSQGEEGARSYDVGHISAAIVGGKAVWHNPADYALWGAALDNSSLAAKVVDAESHAPIFDRCDSPQTAYYFFLGGDGEDPVTGAIIIDGELTVTENSDRASGGETVAICQTGESTVVSPGWRLGPVDEVINADGSEASWDELSFRHVITGGGESIVLQTLKGTEFNRITTVGSLTPQWYALEVSVSNNQDLVKFVVDRSTGLLYTATGTDWRTQDSTTDQVTPPNTKVVPATSQAPQVATINLADLPGAKANDHMFQLAQIPAEQWTASGTPIVVSAWSGTTFRNEVAWALDPDTHEVLWTHEGIGKCFYLNGGTQLLCTSTQRTDAGDGITWDYSEVFLVNTHTGDSQQVATLGFLLESVTAVDGEYILAGSSRGFDGTNDYSRLGAVRGSLNDPSSAWSSLSENNVVPELPERWATYSINSSVAWVGDAYFFALFDAQTGEEMPIEATSVVQALADGTYVIIGGDEGSWHSNLYDASHNLVKSFEHADADQWDLTSPTSSVFVIGNTWYDSATGEPLGKLSGASYLETDPDGVDYWVEVSDDAFYSRHQLQDFHLVNRHSQETGNLLWSSDVTDVVWKLVADSSDEAVIVSTEDDLIALSVTDGTELWRVAAFQPVLRYGAKAEMVGANLAVIDGTQDLKVLSFPVK